MRTQCQSNATQCPAAQWAPPSIQVFNSQLLTLCNSYGYRYVDAYSATLAANGSLRSELTTDGLHMNDAGYLILTNLLGKV